MVLTLKPKSWMILILAIGVIALVIGLIAPAIAGSLEANWLADTFNIPATSVQDLIDFLKPYIAGLPDPTPIS